MSDHGLPGKTIAALEAPMSELTFESVVDRLDEVFSKGWSYHFQGPDLVEVPMKTPKNPAAKNPKVFILENVPHWQCACSIEVMGPEMFQEIVREYSVLVPVQDGAFEVARDLSFIYAAYHGLGVGKKSREIFLDSEPKVKVEIGQDVESLAANLKELAVLKSKLGITSNLELDPFVQEWSHEELASYTSINKSNLRDFTNFLRAKVSSDVRQPDHK